MRAYPPRKRRHVWLATFWCSAGHLWLVVLEQRPASAWLEAYCAECYDAVMREARLREAAPVTELKTYSAALNICRAPVRHWKGVPAAR